MTQLPTSYQPLQATSSLNLHGFQRDFHRQHYSKQQRSLYTNLHTTTNAPSLTSPWMSLALHSLSRQHTDHRLDSTTYRLSLLHRLCLPILPPTLIRTTCICGTALDQYGDHLFSCQSHHKGKLHNAIQDTIAAMLRVLAPIAAFTNSCDSITTETPQLLPNNLCKCPTNVECTCFLPTYESKPLNLLDSWLLTLPSRLCLLLLVLHPQRQLLPHSTTRQREQSSRSMVPVPVFKYLKTWSMNKSSYSPSPSTTSAALALLLTASSLAQMKTKPQNQQQIPHPTATASFYTTWPMAKMPPLTFSDEPMKIGLTLTRTHISVPHTTLASLAIGLNNS